MLMTRSVVSILSIATMVLGADLVARPGLSNQDHTHLYCPPGGGTDASRVLSHKGLPAPWDACNSRKPSLRILR